MRGSVDPQAELMCFVNLEKKVPPEHPLRGIKRLADTALGRLSPLFDAMYATSGRCSIPPERLLKAKLLAALFSVRSDRQMCEMVEYNLLFRWFLDMNMSEEAWDHSVFSKNQQRLLEQEVAKLFFEEVVLLARENGLISQEHFSVDGTLIEAWASVKSFVPRDGSGASEVEKSKKDDPGNPTVNFRGQKRTNQTHVSTSDPEARLARKGNGVGAKPSFGAHALMENRNGLLMDLRVTSATEVTEPAVALELLDRQKADRQIEPESVGGDKGYHTRAFVGALRERGIRPHVAAVDGRRTPGLDARTIGRSAYRISQRIRKRAEEIFGWAKTIGGLRKTRYRGIAKNQMFAWLVGAAYNLLRISRLLAAPT